MPMISDEAVTLAVGFLHVGAASGVTLHTLLNKRDVAAAVAWIGLAWLSPVIGAALYLMFGINRVRRRARQLNRPSIKSGRDESEIALPPAVDHLESLRHAAGRITGRPVESGNRLTPLSCGDEAYPPMVAAIEAAEHSVALSSYIFRADVAGEKFIAALCAAHHRGVAVRVLIDGVGGGYFYSPTYRRLRREGVPVARFLHSELPWRMPFLNMRTHKKILVVDGRAAFTGGLNIGAENLLRTQPREPVRDTHFAVEGPVVGQLAEAFAEDWLFTTGETLRGKAWFPPLAPAAERDGEMAGDAIARVVTSGPDQDLEKLESILLTAIAAARSSIRVVTPYFLPDERICSALRLAALRGVRVDLVLPGQSNHRVVDWATEAELPLLVNAGCHIWHQPPPFDHSKLMTVDAAWCLIGSANWDMRSLRLNFELNLEVYGGGFPARLDAVIEDRLHHRVTRKALAQRPFPVALRAAAARLLMPYL